MQYNQLLQRLDITTPTHFCKNLAKIEREDGSDRMGPASGLQSPT